MGKDIFRLGVGGIVRCGVFRRTLILLSASFSIDLGEGRVNASAVVGVGFNSFLWWNGKLVTASPALVGVVGVAASIFAHKPFATCTARHSISGMADVALLWGAAGNGGNLFVLAKGLLIRLGGWGFEAQWRIGIVEACCWCVINSLVGWRVNGDGVAGVYSWHRYAWPVQEGAGSVGVRFDGAISAAEPFALGVDFVTSGFQCASGVHEGGLEVGGGGHFGEFAVDADIGSSAVGFDDRNAFGDASCVSGVFLVFGGNVFAREGLFLGDGGRFVGVRIADRVEEAVMLVTVPSASRFVQYLLSRTALGRGSVAASANVLG